jgi:flagellar biosynthesis/type III secretory pathway ATPase
MLVSLIKQIVVVIVVLVGREEWGREVPDFVDARQGLHKAT